jgi:hypothetical protein
MTKAVRTATKLGLRPAPPSSPTVPRGRLVPILIVALALIIGVARLGSPLEKLYPVEGDSAKYHSIAQGFARLYAHPIEGPRLWFSHSATPQDLQRYGFDSWVLQHAPAYTAYLGVGYLFGGNQAASGRFLTMLLFVAGALFLYLLTRDLFGPWPALGAALLYLFWPANWMYAAALLTEIPVAAAALGAALAMHRTGPSTRRRAWLFGGLTIGILILTKTTLRFLAVPWIVLEALLDRAPGRTGVLRRGAWRLAGWGGVQLVWLVFLWGFHLSPNPLARTGDDWLWIYRGNYVPDRGWETVGVGDAYTPELVEGSRRAEGLPDDRAKSVVYHTAFQATLREYPGGMLALMLTKAGIFWRFPAVKTTVDAGPIGLPPPARVQPALAVAALLGFALTLGAGARRSLPVIFPLFLTALHAATHLVSRYNAPAIPFAMLYAAGAIAILYGFLRGLLRSRHAPGGVFAQLRSSFPLGRSTWLRAAVFLVPLVLLGAGARASDPDPDQTRIRLERPGDGVRMQLELPPGVRPDAFVSSAIMLDILPSPRGSVTASIRLDGVEVARWNGRPPSDPDAFMLDRDVNRQDDRYKRVLRSVDRDLKEHIRRQRGMAGAGYDFYRQWQRIDVDPATAFADREVTLEFVILQSQGGWIDLFCDRRAPATPTVRGRSEEGELPVRVIEMPAFYDNSYEISSYRFDALSTDRVLADARLVRPVQIASERRSAERIDASGRAQPIAGEPRMRLRGKIPGGYALTRTPDGGVEPAWFTDVPQGLRPLAPEEVRLVQADRDRYFSGFINF